MISVVCWKWKPEQGSKHQQKRESFSAKHVNVLRASIERNTTVSHRFICITDDFHGLHSAVEVVDIDFYFSELKHLGGCYRRLGVFNGSLAQDLVGDRFLCIDIDCVVTSSIDRILGFLEGFKIWEDLHRRRTPYCGSLWGMQAGARQEIYDDMMASPPLLINQTRDKGYIGTDQAIISYCLYPREATWSTEDGVYNFNTQVRKTPNKYYKTNDGQVITDFKRTGDLPNDACLVFFNGKYDPSDERLWPGHPWIRDLWYE